MNTPTRAPRPIAPALLPGAQPVVSPGCSPRPFGRGPLPSALALPAPGAPPVVPPGWTPRPLDAGPLPGPLPLPAPGAPPDIWLLPAAGHPGGPGAELLDAAERARAAEFRSAAARASYVAAHVALRRLLGAYTATAPADVALTRAACPLCGGPHGRPQPARGGPHFSLSHTAGLTVLAFAATAVGVDVEGVPRPGVVAELAGALHPRETAELAALAGPERPAAFARAWVRKEAYLKGLGTGLARSPSRDYVGTGARPGPALLGWTLTDIPLPAVGHAAAVAVRTCRTLSPA